MRCSPDRPDADARVAGVADVLCRLADELVGFGGRNDSEDIVASGELLRGMALMHLRDWTGAERAFHLALGKFERLGDEDSAAWTMTSLAAMILDVEEGSPKWWRLHEEAVRVINRRLRIYSR